MDLEGSEMLVECSSDSPDCFQWSQKRAPLSLGAAQAAVYKRLHGSLASPESDGWPPTGTQAASVHAGAGASHRIKMPPGQPRGPGQADS